MKEIRACAAKIRLLGKRAPPDVCVYFAARGGERCDQTTWGGALPKYPVGIQAELDNLYINLRTCTSKYETMRVERVIRDLKARVFYGRRHYAGIALRAMLEKKLRNKDDYSPIRFQPETMQDIAKHAFEWADAMLAAEEE